MRSRRIDVKKPVVLIFSIVLILTCVGSIVLRITSNVANGQTTLFSRNLNSEPLSKGFAFPRAIAKSMKSSLYEKPFPRVKADEAKQNAVKEAFMHAWNNYEKYCFGHDSLNPLTQTCSDSLKAGLTIVDSMSTMVIMNLTDEFAKSKEFLMNDFKPRGGWSLFEFIIRYLGGLLSAAELSGDKDIEALAIKVGYALLPIMEKTKGFYNSQFTMSTVDGNIQAHGHAGGWCLAEVGTFQLEFLTLAKLTGDQRFITPALNVYQRLWKEHPNEGLISQSIGGGTDSYYEYILKSYILTGGISQQLLDKYLQIAKDVKSKLLFRTTNENLLAVGVGTGHKVEPMMEHLATFVGGMFALGTVKGNPYAIKDLEIADELARTFATVYTRMKSGVMAEQVMYNMSGYRGRSGMDGKEFWVHVDEYILRPESVESVYMMWKMTGLQKYRDYAWEMFKGINKSCRVDTGFSSIMGVDSDNVRHVDVMESFFLAETLKYLYLTFSDSDLISPTEWVFNTEAHPLRIWDDETINKFAPLLSKII